MIEQQNLNMSSIKPFFIPANNECSECFSTELINAKSMDIVCRNCGAIFVEIAG